MPDKPPATLRALDVEARTATIYPKEMATAVEGRAKRALGDRFGLDQFGVNLTTLAPGASSSHRHYHMVEDEFVYVIEGELVLEDDSGRHPLTAGMCAGFKAGVRNAHRLFNVSSKPATYLEIGTRSAVEDVTYPDVDMKAVKSDGKFHLSHKDGTPY
jgi:uncharacterized cupin superfamily protein